LIIKELSFSGKIVWCKEFGHGEVAPTTGHAQRRGRPLPKPVSNGIMLTKLLESGECPLK
jgi:hypothetical protein